MKVASVFHRLLKRQPEQAAAIEYSASPAPEEMLAAELPGKTYQGWRVNWDLTIRSMHSEISPHEIVILARYKRSSASIWVTAPEQSLAEVLQHGSGSLLQVKGEVKAIQGNNIYLGDCQLKFLG